MELSPSIDSLNFHNGAIIGQYHYSHFAGEETGRPRCSNWLKFTWTGRALAPSTSRPASLLAAGGAQDRLCLPVSVSQVLLIKESGINQVWVIPSGAATPPILLSSDRERNMETGSSLSEAPANRAECRKAILQRFVLGESITSHSCEDKVIDLKLRSAMLRAKEAGRCEGGREVCLHRILWCKACVWTTSVSMYWLCHGRAGKGSSIWCNEI